MTQYSLVSSISPVGNENRKTVLDAKKRSRCAKNKSSHMFFSVKQDRKRPREVFFFNWQRVFVFMLCFISLSFVFNAIKILSIYGIGYNFVWDFHAMCNFLVNKFDLDKKRFRGVKKLRFKFNEKLNCVSSCSTDLCRI